MAWITSNKDKTSWYVYDKTPERKNVHLGTFDTEALAKARRADLAALKKRTVGGIDYTKGKLPFRDYVEKWRDEFAVKRASYATCDRFVIAAMLAPGSSAEKMMDTVISNLSEEDIEDWFVARRDEGVSEGTIRRHLTYIKNVIKTCRIQWKMRWLRNPTVDIVLPKGDKPRSRRVRPAERRRLLTVAATGPVYLALVTEFALETAMRQGEIAGVKWDDYDPDHKTLYLNRTKNGFERTVPLTDRAVQLIERAKTVCVYTDGSIFGVTVGAIKQAWSRTVVADGGFPDLHFHDCRHERTSEMFEQGRLDMAEIMSITGHKTHSCLLRYTHLNARHLGRVMRGEARETEAA